MGRPTPKKKCCDSRPRCERCPLRLLKEGRLPEGYAVRHRRLVKVDEGALKDTGGKRKDKHKKKRGAKAAR